MKTVRPHTVGELVAFLSDLPLDMPIKWCPDAEIEPYPSGAHYRQPDRMGWNIFTRTTMRFDVMSCEFKPLSHSNTLRLHTDVRPNDDRVLVINRWPESFRYGEP